MKIASFVADTAAGALERVHAELGAEAVVLSMRPMPRQGFARFWQRHTSVEVLAGVLEATDKSETSRRIADNLESTDLFRIRPVLRPLYDGSGRPHVFIGPPGTGKTTLLCKWMAFSVLNESRTVQVFRLDTVSANTAEFLNVYGEMLGISVERFWKATTPADLCLLDLPGVSMTDEAGLGALRSQLSNLGQPRVHLVLNGAYDSAVLQAQLLAFSAFDPEDVSFCHLDEEPRSNRLGEFLVGTNCSIRFLSTGQKVPGGFAVAPDPRLISPDSAR